MINVCKIFLARLTPDCCYWSMIWCDTPHCYRLDTVVIQCVLSWPLSDGCSVLCPLSTPTQPTNINITPTTATLLSSLYSHENLPEIKIITTLGPTSSTTNLYKKTTLQQMSIIGAFQFCRMDYNIIIYNRSFFLLNLKK